MEKVILEHIKKFIAKMNEPDLLTSVRKTHFAAGYKMGLDAINNIIEMGEALNKKKEVPLGKIG